MLCKQRQTQTTKHCVIPLTPSYHKHNGTAGLFFFLVWQLEVLHTAVMVTQGYKYNSWRWITFLEMIKMGAVDGGWWPGTCLARARPWTRSPAPRQCKPNRKGPGRPKLYILPHTSMLTPHKIKQKAQTTKRKIKAYVENPTKATRVMRLLKNTKIESKTKALFPCYLEGSLSIQHLLSHRRL